MAAKAKPNFEQISISLANQVLIGNACTNIARGLWNADPVVLATAKIFFGLALEGNLQLAQIYAARMFDKTKGAISVYSFMREAKNWAAGLQGAEAATAAEAITGAESRILSLEPILFSLLRRRNEALAHLDPKTVVDPQHLDKNAKLTFPELSKVFVQTGRILNEINALRTGVVSHFEFVGVEDYEMALMLISEAKCAQVDRYEKEFGKPAPFERPKNCPEASQPLFKN